MKHIFSLVIYLCFFFLFLTVDRTAQAYMISECDSINSELTSKFRFLGGWDANGRPEYLELDSDEVSGALLQYVNETLPEYVNLPESDGEYFGEDVQLNTELNQTSEVFLTMVHEGADWKNTLGFYTYDINQPPATVYDIDSMVVIFPNVSLPQIVRVGDKVFLGEFPANTGIGYFLIANGWVGDTICLRSHIVFSDPRLNTWTSEEFRQHTILLNYEQEEQLLLGFEDIQRPKGDNDFNDAVFYITASPGAIDTTNIPKIPTAHLSGDTILCEEMAPAILNVELTGQAPWTIIYNNGIEDIEISGIEDESFSFETLVKDTIRLVSVKDKNKYGIVSGKAVIQLSKPTAVLSEDHTICNAGENQSGFVVDLKAQEPVSLTLKVGEEIRTYQDITEEKLEVYGEIGKLIELIAINDQFCEGEVTGSAVVRSVENPSLAINGNGAICGEGGSAILDLTLDGESPWKVKYELVGESFEVDIASNEYQLEIDNPGPISFTSIEDANCVSTLRESFTFEKVELPTATLEGYTNLCGDSESSVDLALSGDGPWVVQYELNGEMFSAESSEPSLSIAVDHSAMFELIAIEDANCKNTAEGSAEIQIHDAPTASISGDAMICQNGENATISIDLSGTAPFTFVYTDGETETNITTDEQNYTFFTNEFNTYTLVSVEDAFCSGEVNGSATITDGSEAIQVEIQTEDASCFGEEIALELLGETDDLVIEWSTEGNGLFTHTDQPKTTYIPAENETGVIVFYAEVKNGCNVLPVSKEITINSNNELPTASLNGFTSLCGDSEANVDLKLSGDGPWVVQYQLDGVEFSAESSEPSLSIAVDQSARFELIAIKDANCKNSAEGSAEIQIHDAPTASISGDATICQNGENATISVDLSGTAPFTFVYSDGESETTISTDEQQYTFSSNEFKTYTLVNIEDAFCSGEVNGLATITDGSEAIQVEIRAEDASCFGEEIALELLGETDDLLIQWSTEGNGQFTHTDQPTTTYLPADNETGVIVLYAEVKGGCGVKTVSGEVTIIEKIDARFDVSPEKDHLTNTQISFIPSNSNYEEYDWTFGDGNTSAAVIASNEYSSGGKYIVELTASASGCNATESVELDVLSKDELYVPNAFNPNALNAENQVVKVYGNNVDEFGFSFKIVNRWGKVMYETSSFAEVNTVGWGGINNNNGVQQELNVFTYILRGRFIEGDPFEKTGTVTQVK